MRLLELFLAFAQIGLFSVGGGYAAIPLIQEQVVAHHAWLTMSEFTDLVTIAEMTPGPIAVNAATFVGVNVAGIPGALVATLGCITPSLILVSLLSWVYRRYRTLDALQGVLGCLRPAVVALIAAAGLSMLRHALLGSGAEPDVLTGILVAGALLLLRLRHASPILVMLCCGAAGVLAGMVTGA